MIEESTLVNIWLVGVVVGLIAYGWLHETRGLDDAWLFAAFAWPLAIAVFTVVGIMYFPYYVGKQAGILWERKFKKIKNENSRQRFH